MPPLTAQQAALAYDATVPLPVDPNADPDSLIPAGVALDSLAPQQGQNTQPVGNAIENVSGQRNAVDHLASKLLAGGNINIKSQEQFNALSDAQKAVIRAAASTGNINGGVQIKSSDALRIYQDAVKQARQTQVQTVMTSDGRKVDIVNGQIIPAAKQEEPVKMERWQAEDGTMMLTNTTTGRSFPAWDEKTGDSMRGPAKLSATQEDDIKRLQMQSENVGARLNSLTNFTENDKVEYDNKSGNYASAPWMGTKVKELRAQLEKEKSNYDKRIQIALRPVNRSSEQQSQQPAATSSPTPQATPSPTPSVTPSPTPRPTPMPTPDKFIVGRTYKDGKGKTATYRGNGVFE